MGAGMDGKQRLLHGRDHVLHEQPAVHRLRHNFLHSRCLCGAGKATLEVPSSGLRSRWRAGFRDPAYPSLSAQCSLLLRRQSFRPLKPPLTRTHEFGPGSLPFFRCGHLLDLFLCIRRRIWRRHVGGGVAKLSAVCLSDLYGKC